jgi:hypothetical protein
MISEESVIQKTTDLLESMVDSEAVILGMESGKYIGLNEVGTRIWSMLDQPVKVSDLLSELSVHYDAAPEVIREELLEFLNSLYHRLLVRVIHETER